MSIVLVGSTSGSVTLQEPAVAGTTVLTLPAVSGTILTTASSGQSIPKAALPTGSVLQVVQGTTTTTTTYSSAQTWTSMSSFLSASITPTSSSSKILIFLQLGKIQNINGVIVRLTRGGSAIFIGDTAGSRPLSTISSVSGFNGDTNHSDGLNVSYLDSPSTTSSTTYSFDAYAEGSGTTAFNRSIADADNNQEYSSRTASSIILMEIAA
jgi:hypothetical protein